MLNNNNNKNYNHPPPTNESTPNSDLLPFKVVTINANSIIDNSREQLVLDMMTTITFNYVDYLKPTYKQVKQNIILTMIPNTLRFSLLVLISLKIRTLESA